MTKSPSDYPRAQFRLGPLAEAVAARGENANYICQRDLQRYYYLLEQVADTLTLKDDEWNLLRDSLNGVLHQPHDMALLWMGIEDSIHLDGLDEKWGVDGPALIQYLRSLTPIQCAAIVDACERYWQAQR